MAYVCLLPSCQPRDVRAYGSRVPQHPADTLWLNNSTEPETIDPGLCSESAGAEFVQNLFAGLTDTDPKTLSPVADIAERWEVSAEQTRYVFHLRPSAWSDGRPVTASDFVFSWRRVLDPETASRSASMLYVLRDAQAFNAGWILAPKPPSVDALEQAVRARAPGLLFALHPRSHTEDMWVEILDTTEPNRLLAARHALLSEPLRIGEARLSLTPAVATHVGVEAADAHTLVVWLERPIPYFLQLLAHTTLRPVPAHVLQRLAQAQLPETLWTRSEHIVSNGPYVLSQWRFRRDVELTKNPYYWGADDVALAHVKILEVENAQTALNMYRTGQIDWLGANTSLPSAYLRTLGRYADFHQDPLLSVYFYWFNTQVKPLDDIRVRQALSLAVDRAALVKRVMQGGQIPTASLVPDGISGYHALDTPLADIPRAQALLAEAGYPGGAHLPPISLVYNTADEHKQIAEALQAMWSEHLGVEVTLENQEWRVLLQHVQARQFAIARMGWIGDYPDANTFLHDVLSKQSGNNLSGIDNPNFERKLDEANRCPERARRLALLREAETLALEMQPMMPLFISSYTTLVKPYVHGFDGNFLNRHNYKHLSIVTDTSGGAP